MPVHYLLDKERQLVITTGSGRVTFAEARAHQEKLKNDPDFQPQFGQLLDLTAVTGLDLSNQEAQSLARTSPFFATSSRRAWVAPSPFLFGMGRLIGAYREMAGGEEQFRVFYNHKEALKWLGMDVK
jgi:ribonucleotide monophosphatase NagD (HAD superfamily)